MILINFFNFLKCDSNTSTRGEQLRSHCSVTLPCAWIWSVRCNENYSSVGSFVATAARLQLCSSRHSNHNFFHLWWRRPLLFSFFRQFEIMWKITSVLTFQNGIAFFQLLLFHFSQNITRNLIEQNSKNMIPQCTTVARQSETRIYMFVCQPNYQSTNFVFYDLS